MIRSFEESMKPRYGGGLGDTGDNLGKEFDYDEQLYIDVREFWEDHLDCARAQLIYYAMVESLRDYRKNRYCMS